MDSNNDSKSCPAPIGETFAGPDRWRPVPLSQLVEGESLQWLWEDIIARGNMTLLSGAPKVGKSTLLSHMLRNMENGGSFGTDIFPSSVLLVTEEPSVIWRLRRDELGLGDHVHLIARPFDATPTLGEWTAFVGCLADLVEIGGYDLVIIDTLSDVSPIENENDAAQMHRTVTPLRAITAAGAALLLVHHQRKSGGQNGSASRGSSALPGKVDIIVDLGYDRDQNSRRRSIQVKSRVTMDRNIVIELDDEGVYRVIGTERDARQEDRLRVIAGILPADADAALRHVEVRDRWPVGGIPKPSPRTIQNDLKDGESRGRFQRLGKGVAGDPLRYYRPNGSCPAGSVSIDAGPDIDDAPHLNN